MEKNKKKIISIGGVFLLLLSIYLIFDGVTVKASPKKKKTYSSDKIYVDIKGAVKSPGVYEVDKNSRIIDVIEKAGDLKKDADTSIINLSKKVKDEMYIIIYTKNEIKEYKEKYNSSSEIVNAVEEKIICPDSDNDACINKESNNESGKVNINTATESELSSIKGIGKTKAKRIIEYRNKNKFEKIEDIKNVSGIGESLFNKIKDNIEV